MPEPDPNTPRPGARPGFTLIELLVVLSIISLLISLLLPSLSRARDQARQMQCLVNTRQLTSATINYATDNKQTMMRGNAHSGFSQGRFENNPDFYELYTNYVGGHLSTAKPTGLHQGESYFSDLRFRTHPLFICPSKVRRTSSGDYNYFRLAYALWPASTQNKRLTLQALREAGFYRTGGGNQLPGNTPAMWSDRVNVYSGGNNGGLAETNHLAANGRPEGGNVARADGSAAWYVFYAPYDGSGWTLNDHYIRPNGGISGGQSAHPSNAIHVQTGSDGIFSDRINFGGWRVTGAGAFDTLF